MKFKSLLSAFILFIIFDRPVSANLEDLSMDELAEMLTQLEQDVKDIESDIGNKTAEFLQLQMNFPEDINCTVSNNSTISSSTNKTTTSWMQYTAYVLTGLSTALTISGPAAELIKDIRMYRKGNKPIPVGAAGWPTLDFISNGFFLVHLVMSYLRLHKLRPFLQNMLASMSVMAIETGINGFLFLTCTKRKIRGAEGQPLITH